MMLRAVFRLALRQTEGLIGSVLQLLGLDLPVRDHSTISRRAQTVSLPKPPRTAGAPLHLLVDNTGLKLCGPGEWLTEKYGTGKRRSWKKLHVGVDAARGRIVAAKLTDCDVDEAAQVAPLLGLSAFGSALRPRAARRHCLPCGRDTAPRVPTASG
ncbi:transposase [Azospirillum thermophilum]|uniref:transposase n=1 Tax=Azospirillum thermophilum TaxID=2202148 RepID=UPI001FE6582E|nr:transposase [Azospirillum thermophilum]